MVRSFCKSFAARNINERTYHLCNEHHNNFILVEGRSKPVKWRGTGGGSPGEQGGQGGGRGWREGEQGAGSGSRNKEGNSLLFITGYYSVKNAYLAKF